MRGMRLTTLAPHGQQVHVWATRVNPTPQGARQAPVLFRWPATLVHLTREEAIKHGYLAENVHTLVGPWWKGHTLEAGDLITLILAPDGTNYVRSGKSWSVLGRAHDHGLGVVNAMSVVVKEEV